MQRVDQADVSSLDFFQSRGGEACKGVAVDDIGLLEVEDAANAESGAKVPDVTQVPDDFLESVRRVLPVEGPVEVVEREAVDADAVEFFDRLSAFRMKGYDADLVAGSGKGFGQKGSGFLRASVKVGAVERGEEQNLHALS